MDDYKIICKPKYGRIELDAWMEQRGDRFIGMGSSTEYDEDGHIVAHNTAETGLVARYVSL